MAGKVFYLLDSKGLVAASIPDIDGIAGRPFWELFGDGYSESLRSDVAVCVVARQGAQMHAIDVSDERQFVVLHPVPTEAVSVCAVCEPIDRRIDALTARQREICRLLGQGFSGGEIRRRTKLARSTVDGHRNRAMRLLKMGLPDFLVWCVENRCRF